MGGGPGVAVTPPLGDFLLFLMSDIQYLGGEKAQIWRIFNTLAPKTHG